MFGLIIAKFYLKIVDKDDSPIWRICMVSFFLVYPLIFGLILIMFRFLERFNILTRDNSSILEVLTHLISSI